jgi:radical SAM superfamily enzyme YgiQ (UPF0313 family)
MTMRREIPTVAGMRVLLLYPPVLPYSYTLHHRFQRIWEVAQYIRRHYPDTFILDAGLLNALKGQVLYEFAQNYDAVIVYCEPQMLPEVADLVQRCRHISAGTKIMVYGPAAVCFPAQTRSLDIDAIGCRGDLEAQIRQFLDLLAGHGGTHANISMPRGGTWTSPDGPAEIVPASQWGYPPLDEMPMADISRIYAMKAQELTVAVTASRGCPYKCTFCATPAIEGGPDRRRPAQELADYVASNSRFGRWQFYSPTFTLNRKWCLEFFANLQSRKTGISWRCTTRVDRLDEELVEQMAGAGCCMVGIGVETLGPALERVRKEITQDQILNAVKMLGKYGIEAKAYVMFGLPGQSLQDIRKTLAFLTGLGVSIRPSLYSPQGAADELAGESASADMSSVGKFDRRSFLADQEHYGELLRLTFDRPGAWAAAKCAAAGN